MSKKKPKVTIAEVISRLRDHGFTQTQMQKHTGIPQARISKWSKPESTDSRSANDSIKMLLLLQHCDQKVENGGEVKPWAVNP